MMNKPVVIIRDMSKGNEHVGEMWQETKMFDESDTLKDVLDWATNRVDRKTNEGYTQKRITITVPHIDLPCKHKPIAVEGRGYVCTVCGGHLT